MKEDIKEVLFSSDTLSEKVRELERKLVKTIKVKT